VLEPVVLDLSAVTTDMKDLLGRLIGEDIALLTTPTPGLGRVKADRGQVEQVVMNLAVNARDAMPQGGRVILETANVDLDDEYVRRHVGARPGPHVMLAVSDTGSGIPREIQAQIFEPFFTTKEQGKGTGLGLATVYGIVKQSGGYIEVDSGAGPGHHLPHLPAAPRGRGGDGGTGACVGRGAGGSETILLVEDEEGVRELARRHPPASGYTVLEARTAPRPSCSASGTRARSICCSRTWSCPRMSGRRAGRAPGPLRPELSVLYMSGYTDDAVIRHGVLAAGTAFLQKPFTPPPWSCAVARRSPHRGDERRLTRPPE